MAERELTPSERKTAMDANAVLRALPWNVRDAFFALVMANVCRNCFGPEPEGSHGKPTMRRWTKIGRRWHSFRHGRAGHRTEADDAVTSQNPGSHGRGWHMTTKQICDRISTHWIIVRDEYAPPEVRLPHALQMAGDIALLCALLGGWRNTR